MSLLKKGVFYLVFFYLLYLPNLAFISPLFLPSILVTVFAMLNLLLLNRKLVAYLSMFKINTIIFIYLLTLIQLTVLNLMYGFEFINLWPNIQFIFQLINFLSIFIWSNKIFNKESNDIENKLIVIGMIQALLSISMLIFPSFKEVANLLATGGETLELNLISLLNFRMYGIGSSYTFMLPLIQSFIAIISLKKFLISYKFQYVFISVILLISSILNNRTGFYIYLVAAALLIIRYTSKKVNLKQILIFISSFALLIFFLISLSSLYPARFEWLTQGFVEVSNVFTGRQSGGTLSALQSHWEFPKGINFVIGYGRRVFGQIGITNFGFNSDIGFVNDMFKGGLIYVLLTYLAHFLFCFKNSQNQFFVKVLFISLMIANYKGEVMVASSLILLLYLLTFQDLYNEKIVGEKSNEYL